MTDPSSAEVLHQMSDALDQLRELVSGQRAKFLQDGYSPEAAEHMAITIWEELVVTIFAAQRSS